MTDPTDSTDPTDPLPVSEPLAVPDPNAPTGPATAEPAAVDDPYDTAAERRRAHRRFLTDAAMEAERNTGHREQTDDEARHSLWIRLARLIGGWILVLLGLAGLVLPGPGWLIVILGLSLLPYRWTDQLIRTIRRRIPGIPEDGRIPTTTWVIMGVALVATTSASIWWGLRDTGDDTTDKASAPSGQESAGTTQPSGPPVIAASLRDDEQRGQIALVYAAVAANVGQSGTDDDPAAGATDLREAEDPCAELTAGRADLMVATSDEATTCFGGTTPDEVRSAAATAGAKVFGPVDIGGVTYYPIARHDRIARDDEPAELAIDGVSDQLSAGAAVDGDPAVRARELMEAAGVI